MGCQVRRENSRSNTRRGESHFLLTTMLRAVGADMSASAKASDCAYIWRYK